MFVEILTKGEAWASVSVWFSKNDLDTCCSKTWGIQVHYCIITMLGKPGFKIEILGYKF